MSNIFEPIQQRVLHNKSKVCIFNLICMKKKSGETLKSKKFTAKTNEFLCKVIAYNIMILIQEMNELGIEPDFIKE
jgi:hypothetical protein